LQVELKRALSSNLELAKVREGTDDGILDQVSSVAGVADSGKAADSARPGYPIEPSAEAPRMNQAWLLAWISPIAS
jgi:hypothetical protein